MATVIANLNLYNIDHLLYYFQKRRIEVLSAIRNNDRSLVTDVWSDKYFDSDSSCEIEMGKNGGNIITNAKKKSCTFCKTLRPMVPNDEFWAVDVGDKPFAVEIGEFQGAMMVIRRLGSVKRKGGFDKTLSERSDFILKRDRNLGVCSLENSIGREYACFDGTTNKILCRYIVENIIQYAPRSRGVFKCRNDVYVLEDLTRRLDDELLSTLKREDIKSIIIQLAIQLREMSKICFCHGTPSAKYLRYTVGSKRVTDKGMDLGSDYVLSIDASKSSSFAKGRIRYCASSVKTGELDYSARIWNLGNGGLYYKVTPDNYKSIMRHRKAGIPIYSTSLDWYVFFVSLYAHPRVREVVDKELKSLMLKVFPINGEASLLNKRCSDMTGVIESSSEAITLLFGFHLSCSVLETAEQYVRSM